MSFYKNRRNLILKGASCAFLSCLLLFPTGCSIGADHTIEPLSKEMYQKALVETVSVQRGDISPEVNIPLIAPPSKTNPFFTLLFFILFLYYII